MRVRGTLMERILACIADGESWRILASVGTESKSAAAMERDLGYPSSTLYRKLSQMKNCGLLMVDRFDLTDDGRREARFLAAFTEIRIRNGGGEMELELIESRRSVERRWYTTFFSKSDINQLEQSFGDF